METEEKTWICQQCGNIFKGQTINGICPTCAQTRLLLASQLQRAAEARAQSDALVRAQQEAADEARRAAERAEAQAATYARTARTLADIDGEVRRLRREAPDIHGLRQLLVRKDQLALIDVADVEPVQRATLPSLEDGITELIAAYTAALGERAEHATRIHAARRALAEAKRTADAVEREFESHCASIASAVEDAQKRGLDVSGFAGLLSAVRAAPVDAADEAVPSGLDAVYDALQSDVDWEKERKLSESEPPAPEAFAEALASYRRQFGAARSSFSAYLLHDPADGWLSAMLEPMSGPVRAAVAPTLRSLHARAVEAIQQTDGRDEIQVPSATTALGTMQSIHDEAVDNAMVVRSVEQAASERSATRASALSAARALKAQFELASRGVAPGWGGWFAAGMFFLAPLGILFAAVFFCVLFDIDAPQDGAWPLVGPMYIFAGYKIFVRDNWKKQVAFNVGAVRKYALKLQSTTLNVKLDLIQAQRHLIGFRVLAHHAQARRDAHATLARCEADVRTATTAAEA